MKRLLLIAVLSLVTVTNIKAQEKGSIELGVNAGVNFSAATSGGNNTNNLTGFNFAAVGEYYFSDTWGIRAKLIYDTKGWADGFYTDQNNNTFVTDFKLNYLTLPVTANWHFGSKKNWYLNFGLYAGFLLNAKTGTNDIDVKDSFEGVDFGLALGIGYKFSIDENTKLFIDFDGQGGLTGIFKQLTPGTTTIKNNRSAINFGVLFNL